MGESGYFLVSEVVNAVLPGGFGIWVMFFG